MKIKTSVSLDSVVARALDRVVGKGGSRSAAIELAVKEFLARRLKQSRDARELAVLNRHADRLNREAEDVLTFQVIP